MYLTKKSLYKREKEYFAELCLFVNCFGKILFNMEIIKVAIVEDDNEFRNFWVDVLNSTDGFTCIAGFDNSLDAIKNLPDVLADIVLMDIYMPPNASGIEVIRKIRTKCPNTQFMIFSAWSSDSDIFDSLKAGAKSYVLKNTTEEKVLEAIRELKAGGSPMSSTIARRVIESFESQPNPNFVKLLPTETQILKLLSEGKFYKEIAPLMHLNLDNLKQKIHVIYSKLEVSNRTEAINLYREK